VKRTGAIFPHSLLRVWAEPEFKPSHSVLLLENREVFTLKLHSIWEDEKGGGDRMWDLDELKKQRDIVEAINWEMTPESAIETYLEWGTGWSRKDSFMSHSDQESYYFVVYDWETPLSVTLIRRDVRDVDELAKIQAPEELIRSAIDEGGRKPGVGVYAISAPLKGWLREALNC
jgi:hypothetical protein